MRDTSSTKDYFQFAIEDVQKTIERRVDLLKKGEGSRINILFGLNTDYLRLSKLYYSIGKPIDEIQYAYLKSLEIDLLSVPLRIENKKESIRDYIGIFEYYIDCLLYTSDAADD